MQDLLVPAVCLLYFLIPSPPALQFGMPIPAGLGWSMIGGTGFLIAWDLCCQRAAFFSLTLVFQIALNTPFYAL